MKDKVAAMRRRVGPLGLSLLAAALTAAAFAAVSVAAKDGDGGSQGNGQAGAQRSQHPAPPQLSESDRQALEEYRQCLEENGAPAPPDPSEMRKRLRSGERPDPPSEEELEKLRQAEEACADELPEAVELHGGPGGPGCGPGGPPPPEGAGQEGTSAPAPEGRAQGDVLPAPQGASS